MECKNIGQDIFQQIDLFDSKCETCEKLSDMSDQNVHKRKTRRGRRKPFYLKHTQCVTPNEGFTGESMVIQRDILNDTTKRRSRSNRKTLLRTPVSPKAPMNSTQFLIEDRGEYINFDDSAYSGFPSPDQMLSSRSNTPDVDGSFYSEADEKLTPADCRGSSLDSDYVPIEETTDFMGREFEREFAESQYSFEMDTRLSLKNKLIKESSKQDIVGNLMSLELRLKEMCSDQVMSKASRLAKQKSFDLMSEIEFLRKENLSLKEENDLLKSLISS